VRIADVRGEEFDITPGGGIAGVGDQRRHQVKFGVGRERGRLRPGGRILLPRSMLG
jgi:hypothetical protein